MVRPEVNAVKLILGCLPAFVLACGATPPSSSGPEATPATPNPCAAATADAPLEEGSLVDIRPGDALDSVDDAAWGESWVRSGEVVHTEVAGRHLLLVPLDWPGNAAALALVRESPAGLCLLNVWSFAFGGNGIDPEHLGVEPADDGSLRIRLDLVGHTRGYYADPGDEATYVEPSDESLVRTIGTDGEHAWMIEDASAAP
jgi:hypothetical protein